MWDHGGWWRWALWSSGPKMQLRVRLCDGHHNRSRLLLLNFIVFIWSTMRVAGRCRHGVGLVLLPSSVEVRGVSAGRCWINGGRQWSNGEWKKRNDNGRAPSLDQTLILHKISSPVCTGMEETFKKGKNETIFKDMQYFLQCSYEATFHRLSHAIFRAVSVRHSHSLLSWSKHLSPCWVGSAC